MLKNTVVLLSLALVICSASSQNIIPEYKFYKKYKETSSASSVYPVTLAAAIGLYFLNPIVIYDDKRLFMGITKELSLGFGYFGQHRLGLEYSFIVSGNISHHFRAGYKYDFLLSKLKPSNTLQGTAVVSFGAGYFTDFVKNGIFPEITYGYSLRNHKLLLYPHIKLRHTFMLNGDRSDITDFSFGFMVGIANPFIDLKIRRNY